MHLPARTRLQDGKYEILEKIGQGGFGIAYKANHQMLDKTVCIKEFFYSDLCERKADTSELTIISASKDKIQLVNSFKKKFLKEAQRLATFQHPNIVQVSDVFEENNTAYFVMEYLEGGSLHDKIGKGKLSEKQTLDIILPILDALSAVHKAKLLHLDIKPLNIMFRKDQTPVLIDFGISKYMADATTHTTTAPLGISKGYAPLEQYGGDISDFSEATDLYSVCATMYSMVCGVIPPEPLQILGLGLKSPQVINPNLSDKFNAVIVKGMAVKSGERFSRAKDIAKKLKTDKHVEYTSTIESEKSTIISLKNKATLDRYEEIDEFYNGLARVKLDDKYGYIDKSGNIVISCIYDKSYGFLLDVNPEDYPNGMIHVELNGKCGLIDKYGNQIISCKYFSFILFSEGLFSVMTIKGVGYVDVNENVIIPFKIQRELGHFEGGVSVDRVFSLFNKKYILIDKTGKKITNKTYDVIKLDWVLSSGLVCVNKNGKWGFINKQGNQVTTCQYEDVGGFSESMVGVKLNSKWGFLDKQGSQVILCKYDEVGQFSEGLAKIKLNGKWGYIDNQDNLLIHSKYDDAADFSEGLALVQLNEKYGFIDKNGSQVIPCIYEEEMTFSEGMIAVKLNNKWGYFDKHGNQIVPYKYDDAENFSEGLALVQLNGKYGFINKQGSQVVSCLYDCAYSFSDGLAKVELNGKIKFIDKNGDTVLE